MTLMYKEPNIADVLRDCKVIAVVGFHADRMKPAHYVPEYMYRQGYAIIPVNPILTAKGQSFFGHKAVATLKEITIPVDVVEVFRRNENIPDHLEDILAMNPLPKVVWLQQGIRHPEVAHELFKRGINVVQDRCMLAEHRNLT